MVEEHTRKAPSREKLEGFRDYEDYLAYARELFDLKPEEYEALFKVLVKLQSMGQNPTRMLQSCKEKMGSGECTDMLRFMMYVDGLDLDSIKEMA